MGQHEFFGQAAPRGTFDPRDFGAKGNGTADDTAAIRAAIAEALAYTSGPFAGGGRVSFSPGVYGTSEVIEHPEHVEVVGSSGQRINYGGAAAPTCVVKALGTHAGTALWRMRGKVETGRSLDHVGATLRRLTFDGAASPAGTKGIVLAGLVREATLDDVTVFDSSDAAFWCGGGTVNANVMPQSLRFHRCVADAPGGAGFSFSNVPDSTMVDCLVLGASWVGYYFAGFQHGIVLGCRSEWSTQHGFVITSGYWGTGAGAGGMHLVGCSTDRSGFDGMRIEVSGGSQPIQVTGFDARRDGRNGGTGGGGYAGLRVAGAVCPVTVDNLVVGPGVDDDGTKTSSPQYGVSSSGATAGVRINSGVLQAMTAPVFDAGGNSGGFIVDPAAQLATGTTAAPVRTPVSGPLSAVPDADWYGDVWSSMERFYATTNRAAPVGTQWVAIGRATRTFVARAVRAFCATASSGTAGTTLFTVLVGNSLAAMTVVGTFTTPSQVQTVGLIEGTLSATSQVRQGQYVAVSFYPLTYGTTPPAWQCSGASGGPAAFVSPSAAFAKNLTKAAAPAALGATVNLTDGTWTLAGNPGWCALVP